MDLIKSLVSISKSGNHKILNILGLKFKYPISHRPLFFKDFLKEQYEKDIISNSIFWDDLWYVQTYNHNFSSREALDYWYHKGWKKGENPSKYINVNFCKPVCKNVNPIIAYMSNEYCFSADKKNNFKEESDNQKIVEYLKYKKTRQSKSVMYTCITNDYDDLQEIETYKYIDKDWDYICFSDNEELIQKGELGIWKIKPLQFTELDNTRNQRWHKIFAHKLFPEYNESVWIDGNINVLSNKIFSLIHSKQSDILVPKHFNNLCIYSEYNYVKNSKLDDIQLINKELEFIKNEGMPKNYGFAETNILYRKHNKQNIQNCMELWWEMVKNYSKRDQLSFTYALWKNDIKPKDINIDNTRLDVNNFYLFPHRK